MKISFIIFGFISTCGLIYGYPASSEELEHLLFDTEFNDYHVDEKGHKVVKKAVEFGSKMKVNDEELEEPCRLTLPMSDSLPENELSETYNEENVRETSDVRTMSNTQYLPYEETPYLIDYTQGFPEDFNLIPYRTPEEYMSRFPPVRSLPPVYSTKIYEMIPNDNDDSTFFENENLFNIVPSVRAVRSDEDDLLAELEKESVIPNLLPTMPFPYMRDAGIYGPIQKQQYVAVYPVTTLADCALPFLLNCSPQVKSGLIKYAKNPSEYTSPYRNVDFDKMP